MSARLLILAVVLMCGAARADLTIVCWSNSTITWTNSVSNGYYQLQWSPDMTDAWQAGWSNQAYFGGTTNRTITIDIPRYYRLGWDSNAWATEDDREIGTNETEYAFAYSGRTTFDNIDAGAFYAVDFWAGTNWSRSWHTLGNMSATGSQQSCSAPTTYRLRVLAINVPVAVPGMTWVFAGTYSQGSPTTSAVATVSGCYLDTYEVSELLWSTVRQWGLTNGYTDLPAGTQHGETYPVVSVSWLDAVKWCNARSELGALVPVYYDSTNIYRVGTCDVIQATAAGYRLPTEAEWEQAARGFIVGAFFPWGGTNNADCTGRQANYSHSGDLGEYYTTQLSPCGGYYEIPAFFRDYPGMPGETNSGAQWIVYTYQYPANGYGLYDMAGNVWEWCWDRYGYDTYPHSGTNYTGPATGTRRVVRGGCYGNAVNKLTVYNRAPARPEEPKASIGFRCARSRP